MPLKIQKPWWVTDKYEDDSAIPAELEKAEVGPNGIALVKLWESGQTSAGWGLTGKDGAEGFIPRYKKKAFDPRRALNGYEQDKWAFAIVMRSLNLVAIDIDGKNGGLDHAEELLMGAPPTLAEISKSGNGMHLFYSTDDEWTEDAGFGQYMDHIGIVTGVDIKGVGCVFHHKQQRWNDRPIAPLPKHVSETLLAKSRRRAQAHQNIEKILEGQDDMDILIMQEDILTELNKSIPKGKRNTTLFAIGTKMKKAQIPDWQEKLEARALAVGLTTEESAKLPINVASYGV